MNLYTTALKRQRFQLTYVDLFAGSGRYKILNAEDNQLDVQPGLFALEREYDESRALHKGSASLALEVTDKPFDRLIFIDNDLDRVQALHELEIQHPNRNHEIHEVDANVFMPEFCKSMGMHDRALVFLDPFATQVSWNTVEAITQTGKSDCWILFPLMAVTRMMPVNFEPGPQLAKHLDRIFGGRKHWTKEYQDQPTLFVEKTRRTRPKGSQRIANLYKERLQDVFHKVAENPCTLKNSRGGPLFELFFAASNSRSAPIAIRMADHILKGW